MAGRLKKKTCLQLVYKTDRYTNYLVAVQVPEETPPSAIAVPLKLLSVTFVPV